MEYFLLCIVQLEPIFLSLIEVELLSICFIASIIPIATSLRGARGLVWLSSDFKHCMHFIKSTFYVVETMSDIAVIVR